MVPQRAHQPQAGQRRHLVAPSRRDRYQLWFSRRTAGSGEHVGLLASQYSPFARNDAVNVGSKALVGRDWYWTRIVIVIGYLRKAVGASECRISVVAEQTPQHRPLRARRIVR